MSAEIKLLVCDMDNTLYDWVTFFTLSFYEMVEVAVRELSVGREELLADLKKVHQRHGNTEHPFSLLEADSVLQALPGLDRAARRQRLMPAFEAFSAKRRELLRLYPGVQATLSSLAERGVPMVAHTEATTTNAFYRLERLEIDRFFRRLYAVTPPDDPHPSPDFSPRLHTLPVRYLRQDERKPDPRVLLEIADDFGCRPFEMLYVGDSLTRDIGMAKEVGAHAAWAKYGMNYDSTLWPRLVQVTHWMTADYERTRLASERHGQVKPDVELESFDGILGYYSFTGGIARD